MRKITIIGGDNRLRVLKERLLEEGFFVDSIALFENDRGSIKDSDVLILPIPTTKDKKTVFAPLVKREIFLTEIEEQIGDNTLVLSCNYTFSRGKNIDIGSLDSYSLLNSVPTAEGALKIAIENTDFTLWKSKVLVIGFGRVGKILADRLKAFGAFVTVSARKAADFALLDALGFDYINTSSLNLKKQNYDIIFNTIDAKVIEDKNIENLNCELVIDLSTFGAFSLDKASEKGIRVLKAPALPNKTAPKTAAEILSDTVLNILNS